MQNQTASQSQATVTLPPPPEQEQQKPDSIPQPVDTFAGSPTLIDFLHVVPPPLVALLVHLGPPVSSLHHAARILSWKSSWVDSWLLLAAWWVLVLFADRALRYFLPFVITSALLYFRQRQAPNYMSQPITEASIQGAVRDLASLLSLLPQFPTLPTSLSPSKVPSAVLFRACVIVTIPYFFITCLISVRVLLGLFGTIVLTYRAPFAQLLRAALWRSAFVRWAVYRCWAYLSGEPMPYPIPTPVGTADAARGADITVTTQLRFTFTVYENQRWWMGLDWTAALLPGERPSWCSALQAPLPPPAAFALPAPTTAFLSADGVPNAREKCTATWVWTEPEWRVVVRREGETPADAEGMEKPETDADGWVYGDNKWESHSGKGGLGKYTRYRRWTRVAILTETTERVGPGPTGVLREDGALQSLPGDTLVGSEKAAEKEKEKRDNLYGSPSLLSPNERSKSIGLGVVGSTFRQRLQAAVSGSH